MSNDVFANGREISCKKGDGKTICEFPDVCFTPPENPATPPGVPVPYPNTALSSDTTEGSKNVKISGQEVMLKNSSYFKTSSGDEAGAAAKKGVITSTNKGKAYFIAWSMDVKFEGENVVRHLDMTTNNHASPAATGAAPSAHIDSMTKGGPAPKCEELKQKRSSLKAKLPTSKKVKKNKNEEGEVVSTTEATLAVGATILGGKLVSVKASASSVRVGGNYNGKYSPFANGVEEGQESNAEVCGKKNEKFKYKEGQARPKEGHAEAKLIEDFFKKGGVGKLVISVSKEPCEDCQRLIDEVNGPNPPSKKKCDKVIICPKKGY